MACSVARERIPRLMAELSDGGMAAAVLCSRPSLRYYAGFAPPLVSSFSVQSPVLGACLLRRDEAPLLFLALELSETPFEEVPHELVVQYSLAVEETWPEQLCARVGEQLRRLPAGKLGFEMRNCAAEFERRLEALCPHLQFVPIEPLLARLRAIKDEDELAAIREAVALADLGQEVVRRSARPGLCELELFEAARRAIDLRAGRRVAMIADLISGERTAESVGDPTTRQMAAGELLISDFGPHWLGYWGETCNTLTLGAPNPAQYRAFEALREALGEGLAHLRPGVKAGRVDERMRSALAAHGGSYFHHSGHGIGLLCHESPTVVPGCEMPLAAGMVVALEPGIYFPRHWGMRIKQVAVVTEHGGEPLSRFRHCLF